MKSPKVFLLIFAIALLFSACTHVPTNNSTRDDTNSAAGGGTTLSDSDVDMVIEMNGFRFDPDLIQAEAGETVTLKVKSLDMDHDFVVDELNVSSGILNRGEEATFDIKIPDDAVSGETYEFYCGVSNHRALGMVGEIIVR